MADSPYEEVAIALKTIIDAEYAAESYTAIHDDIHESLGTKRTEIGISPDVDAPTAGKAVQEEHYITVKFYDRWKKEISPDTVVNPFRITAFAERFKKAVKAHNDQAIGTDAVWFFTITRITYPRDPTGNKTRFVATIKAFGHNAGLVETSA